VLFLINLNKNNTKMFVLISLIALFSSSDSTKTTELQEYVFESQRSINEKPLTIGKLPIRPMDLPQSVMTLDRTLLEAQQVRTMSDVLMNTNGVYIMGTTGGYQEEISARGFAMGSSNTFKNGMRYANGMMTELSGIERVEILKGSAAILYGNVAAGGVLNLVTKKPKFNFGGEVGLRGGSWSYLKPSIDLYGGLSSKVAVRLNSTYEQGNSFREGVSSRRVYLNPSLLFKFNEKTEWLLEGDYLEDNRTPDFGAGIINYKIVDIPRERFLGVRWSYMNQNQASITSTITHHFSAQWTLKVMAGLRNNGFDLFANTRPNAGTFVSEKGTWVRNLQKANARENYGMVQVDLIGNVQTGSIKHQVLVGADSDFFNTVTNAFTNYASYDTIHVFGTKAYTLRSDQPAMSPSTITTAPIHRIGIYAQDLVHMNERIKLLAGLRYSYQQTTSEVFSFSSGKTTVSDNFDGAFSPRLGIVIQPSEAHAFFASYSNSFALNTGIDVNNKALPPSLIDQYEVGVKNELLGGILSANVTAYRILNNNLAQNILVNPTTYSYVKELVGSVQSEGIEIDLGTKAFHGFTFTGGYSYNETKYVKSNTYIEGSLLRYNPNHTANVGVNFRKKRWQAALTSVYIGQRFAGRSTRVAVANDAYHLIELPAYTQVDVSLAYQVKTFTIRSKIANLGDVISYNVHDDNSVNPISPRNYSLSLTYNF
jgi:iron complex outermembrane receptor protein